MDDEHTTRQQRIVPEAIKAIRAELMQKESDRPPQQSAEISSRTRMTAPARRAG